MIHNTDPINLTMWHDKTTKSEKGLHYVGTSHCSASYSLQLIKEKRNAYTFSIRIHSILL